MLQHSCSNPFTSLLISCFPAHCQPLTLPPFSLRTPLKYILWGKMKVRSLSAFSDITRAEVSKEPNGSWWLSLFQVVRQWSVKFRMCFIFLLVRRLPNLGFTVTNKQVVIFIRFMMRSRSHVIILNWEKKGRALKLPFNQKTFSLGHSGAPKQ